MAGPDSHGPWRARVAVHDLARRAVERHARLDAGDLRAPRAERGERERRQQAFSHTDPPRLPISRLDISIHHLTRRSTPRGPKDTAGRGAGARGDVRYRTAPPA